jgi:DNA-binding response OmpR family regulator
MKTSPTQELSGVRILVVEDTLLIAELIVDHLQDAGCDVIGPASRVGPALALAEREKLDGALLDLNLRGELCFPIADVLVSRGVPIAFLTGYGDSAVPAAYKSAPRLTKPFQLKELTDLVRRHFGEASSGSE